MRKTPIIIVSVIVGAIIGHSCSRKRLKMSAQTDGPYSFLFRFRTRMPTASRSCTCIRGDTGSGTVYPPRASGADETRAGHAPRPTLIISTAPSPSTGTAAPDASRAGASPLRVMFLRRS